MATHYEGPLLGSVRSVGGLYQNFPVGKLDNTLVVEYFEDFRNDLLSDMVDTGGGSGLWIQGTAIGAGPTNPTAIVEDTFRGLVRMDVTAANTGTSIQPKDNAGTSSVMAVTAASQEIIFEAGVGFDIWGNADWLIGLGRRDLTPMSTAGAILTTFGDDFAGFHHLETGSGVPLLKVAGTAVANVQTVPSTWTTALTDSTFYHFGIRISGLSRVRFYINGRAVSAWTTISPALATGAPLVPTFAVVANGAHGLFDVDYVRVMSFRPY